MPLTDIQKRALALYKPPFRFESGYIFDANREMVADQDRLGPGSIITRIRGWGRIKYLPEPEKLQDAVGELVVLALNAFWHNNSLEEHR